MATSPMLTVCLYLAYSKLLQELTYRKHQTDRASAAHTIRRGPNYTVTLKPKLRVTQGHWKRYHWIDITQLTSSRVTWRRTYNRDLEMWVRGHSRSLQVVPFESLSAVSYSLSTVTMAVSLTVCPFMTYSASKYSVTLKTGLGVVQGHWKWRRSIDHIRLSIGRPL